MFMISLLRHIKGEIIIGQKDLAEKQLLQWHDVFAGISNVNLFQGERILSEENLSVEPTNAVIKMGAGELKEMRSDIHMKRQ